MGNKLPILQNLGAVEGEADEKRRRSRVLKHTLRATGLMPVFSPKTGFYASSAPNSPEGLFICIHCLFERMIDIFLVIVSPAQP